MNWMVFLGVYIPIWTIKDFEKHWRNLVGSVVYIPIWTIKDMQIVVDLGGICGRFTFQYGRLKTTETIIALPKQHKFTFQYGRLKTRNEHLNSTVWFPFTFQYGRLKTSAEEQGQRALFRFTFQYGRLKTSLPGGTTFIPSCVYIPIWTIKDATTTRRTKWPRWFTFQYGRLKTWAPPQNLRLQNRLHSNMDD